MSFRVKLNTGPGSCQVGCLKWVNYRCIDIDTNEHRCSTKLARIDDLPMRQFNHYGSNGWYIPFWLCIPWVLGTGVWGGPGELWSCTDPPWTGWRTVTLSSDTLTRRGMLLATGKAKQWQMVSHLLLFEHFAQCYIKENIWLNMDDRHFHFTISM